ncbi:hypothetical protein PLUA15_320022 [Pseudomonas lundensis]|uniref:Uncharacterized protein n=1 Tax=Pseudomonas lundensis TaxID=86185 RepID=A0AAX2H8X2_9PSED|nr:hypothetical protein PLUA15_320022 [Pseudomonas lundensis]
MSPNWRYADRRIGLLDGAGWLAARPIICRSLGLTIDAKITLDALSVELDATWQAVAARLRDNPAIQFSENADGKTELSLGALGRPAALGRFAQARPSAGEPHHANAANRGSSDPSDPVAGRIRTNREDVAHADVHR